MKPAIFDLLLAVCIAAYLGMMYLAIQVSHCIRAVVCSSFHQVSFLCKSHDGGFTWSNLESEFTECCQVNVTAAVQAETQTQRINTRPVPSLK